VAQKRIDRSGNESEFTRLANLDANFDDVFDVMAILDADYTFVAKTGYQQLLNSSPNGALNLPVGLYTFDTLFNVFNASISSGYIGFQLGGSATIESQLWPAYAGAGTETTPSGRPTTLNVGPQPVLVGSSTAGQFWAEIRGIFRLLVGGTIIPQISFSVTAGVIPTVKKNSFFRVKKLNQVYSASIIQPPLPKANNDTPFWS